MDSHIFNTCLHRHTAANMVLVAKALIRTSAEEKKKSADDNNYTGVLNEDDSDINRDLLEKTYSPQEISRTRNLPTKYVWRNVVLSILMHLIAFNEIRNIYLGSYSFMTVLSVYLFVAANNLSVTVGAHRLWSHRSFKARLPLKLLLMVVFTSAGQNSVYEWARDHRVHHKFTETDADPHNIKRGFFFAHMGWLLCKKHPDVKEKGKTVDLSDMESDRLITWHHKWYPYISPIFIYVLPTWLFSYAFPDLPVWNVFALFGVLRYLLSLHITWMINSYAHVYGHRPYDKTIKATDSKWYSWLSMGEGWHNYHHVFPWDYKASEWPAIDANLSIAFIELMAWLGLAYDLKTVDEEMIKKRAIRTGDGSHPLWEELRVQAAL